MTPASANLISYIHSFPNLNLETVKNKTIDFDRASEFATQSIYLAFRSVIARKTVESHGDIDFEQVK